MNAINIKKIGFCDYLTTLHGMKKFTENRLPSTPDELWVVEYPPIFTQGQAGKTEHIINAHNIPVIQSDRGGQVTYHGPGQLIIYTLIDLHRLKLNMRSFVSCLENSVIQLLSDYGIQGYSDIKRPGVFVDQKKISSVGLRVSKGKTYHGLSFNVAMDLEPFTYIHPCGFEDLKITQLSHYIDPINMLECEHKLCNYLLRVLR